MTFIMPYSFSTRIDDNHSRKTEGNSFKYGITYLPRMPFLSAVSTYAKDTDESVAQNGCHRNILVKDDQIKRQDLNSGEVSQDRSSLIALNCFVVPSLIVGLVVPKSLTFKYYMFCNFIVIRGFPSSLRGCSTEQDGYSTRYSLGSRLRNLCPRIC